MRKSYNIQSQSTFLNYLERSEATSHKKQLNKKQMIKSFKDYGLREQNQISFCIRNQQNINHALIKTNVLLNSYRLSYKQSNFHANMSNDKKRKSITKFSDLKDKKTLKSNEIKCYENKNAVFCQNHTKSKAKYYIYLQDQEQQKELHYFCEACAGNLIRKNFSVFILNQKYQNMQYVNIQEQAIKMKQRLNRKLQQVKCESELKLIEAKIEDLNEKYLCIFQVLQKMRIEEIIKLQQLKLSIIEQISNKQSQILNLSTRLQRVLNQMNKNQTKQKEKQQYFNDIVKNIPVYTQSLNKIKIQINQICKSKLFIPKSEQKQLKIQQICQKLQSILFQRTYQLSFEDQPHHQVKQDKLKKYLFSDSRQHKKQNNPKNSQTMIIDDESFVQQEESYFDNQQNIMINN